VALDIPCPRCGKLPPPPCGCVLPPGPPDPPARKLYPEILKLRREKRGGGREVVIVEGFNPGTQVDLDQIARRIKRACGTGGTVRGRTLEIQGDHRDAIAEVLLEFGFRSKRAGG
jgi:translation initiation factor 1